MNLFDPPCQLHVPVLLIVFNRPKTTKLVFEAIRKAKPTRLYIAGDGPRKAVKNDAELCAEVRNIVDHVDWECEVKTLFSVENQNCGIGPSTAITWFFDHEEEGIILEDDCLPSQSFFWFCQSLLEHYRNDYRVMHIGGNNFLQGWTKDKDYSYYFSRSGFIWGWATWRRAWKKFDFKISQYAKARQSGLFHRYFPTATEKMYRFRKWDQTLAKRNVDWWDYQWDFARYANSGLAIVPHINLVKNIGFGELATHTTNLNSKNTNMEAHDISFPLHHPPFMIRDVVSDKKYFKIMMKDILSSKLKSLIKNPFQMIQG